MRDWVIRLKQIDTQQLAEAGSRWGLLMSIWVADASNLPYGCIYLTPAMSLRMNRCDYDYQ